jgi:TRAP-type mannitol/chloroaromatic compound transport system substrate-binding protein
MRRERILKPIGLSLFLVALVIVCLAFVAPVAMAQQKVYNFRLQRYEGMETEEVFIPFPKQIDAMSGGRIEIKNFRGGELVPNDQLLDAVGKGTLEMAVGSSSYWPGMIDVAKIEFGLPGGWTTIGEVMDFYYGKGFIKLAREAYAEKGVYFLGPRYGGPYDLLTKKPVHSLKDLKTMKIRASSIMASILKKFNIPTVFLPAEELYTALGSGTIDGLIYGGVYDYYTMKMQEVAKYYTELNLQYPGYVDDLLINLKLWQSLPPDIQALLEFATVDRLNHLFTTYTQVNLSSIRSQHVFTVGTLPPEDSAALTQAAQDVWNEEAAKSARNAKAIQMLKEVARAGGRIK